MDQKTVLRVGQRLLQRTVFGNRFSPPIPLQQFLGSPGQQAPHFSAFSFYSWDRQRVVAGGLMTHPGNDGSLGSLFDRNALGPGNRATPDRRGMSGDGTGEPVGDFGMVLWKARNDTTAPRKSSTYSAWALSRRRASASFFLAKPSVDRSASKSARMHSKLRC